MGKERTYKSKGLHSLLQWIPVALACNLLLLVVGYMLCRLAFFLENHALFRDLSTSEVWSILRGGVRFDLSAIAYSNALYLLLLFLPLHVKERPWWQVMLRVLFVVINAICLASNLADAVYYPFIKRRATASIFREFQNDSLGGIIGLELIRHWYLTLLALFLVYALWRCYRTPRLSPKPLPRYYLTAVAGLLLSVLFIVAGIRGGLGLQRPLHSGHAREYVQQPAHAVLVLNTPFSIFRTASKKAYPTVNYYEADALRRTFTPERTMVADSAVAHRDNIVILILESFSSEYSKRLNPYCTDEGNMPFLDSLMGEGFTPRLALANGLSSIDAQASVFASIPMMIESLMSSRATMNKIDGLGHYLHSLGYSTAYFHGADNGSLSIDGFVKACGMDAYYGRNEYGDDRDWDHFWGIWDEPFMQYMVQTLNHTPEPFCAGLFTVTSHHPFQIPAQYNSLFPEDLQPVYRAIRYTDHSLRRFFESARQQPWYDHTLFILTGDHINIQFYPEFMNDLGRFRVPLLFYHPTDSVWRHLQADVAQQIDILPTVLHYVGYAGGYFAFGNDLLDASRANTTGAVSYINGIYQYVEAPFLLQFDGAQSIALYDFSTDPLLQANLIAHPRHQHRLQTMERKLKAIIQQYMTRMNENRLVFTSSKLKD